MEGNILVIVEGEKTETRFFERLAEVFGLKFNIYCFATNIYTLYKKMKDVDFNANIKDILLEKEKDSKNIEILSKKFAYTYLVFDCDLHHTNKGERRSHKETMIENMKELSEMAKYFVDETDPSIGKLCINYPMMESYRDSNDFFEEEYAKRTAKIDKIKNYKNIVSTRKICKCHINKMTNEQFSLLILQNLFKLNFILKDKWEKHEYSIYLHELDSLRILNKQNELVTKFDFLSVLNSSLFLIVDYFGNRNGFYEKLEYKNKSN